MRDNLLHVLQHSLGRDQYGQRPRGAREDYRNHFCAGPSHTDFDTCKDAVTRGFMHEHAPREISGSDFIFTVTEHGKAYVDANSPSPPKLSRSQQRYRAFLNEDSGMTFGEWLRAQWLRRVAQ